MQASTRNEELCKYAHFKYMYANGDKRGALDRLKEFGSNLALQLTQYQQFLAHQQQQMNMAQIGAQLPGASLSQQIPQLPASFHMLNTRDIQKRRIELESLLSKCYLKLGQWSQELENFNSFSIEQIIAYFKLSREHNSLSYKSWQAWAYANYEAIQFYRNNNISNNHRNSSSNSVIVPQQQQQMQSPPSSPQPQAVMQSLSQSQLNSTPMPSVDFNQQKNNYVKQAIKVIVNFICKNTILQ